MNIEQSKGLVHIGIQCREKNYLSFSSVFVEVGGHPSVSVFFEEKAPRTGTMLRLV